MTGQEKRILGDTLDFVAFEKTYPDVATPVLLKAGWEQKTVRQLFRELVLDVHRMFLWAKTYGENARLNRWQSIANLVCAMTDNELKAFVTAIGPHPDVNYAAD